MVMQLRSPRFESAAPACAPRLALRAAALAAVLATPALASGQPVVTASRAPLPPPDPAAAATIPQTEYRIGPLDILDIGVFGVETLTGTFQVDASGQIVYPLIGSVQASAKTPRELGDEIAAMLSDRYLQSPQVTVYVKTSLSQRFTVEGAVASPGVYDIAGRMTLLQAIATAKGVDESANLRNIVVFREIDGQRRAGLADLGAIRSGKAPDPQIYAGDTIVVASSGSKKFLSGLLRATPLFNLLAF